MKVRNQKVRITVEFPSTMAADAWFASVKLSGHLPDEALAWPMDALDHKPGIKEYIVRGNRDVRIGEPLKGDSSAMAMFDEG